MHKLSRLFAGGRSHVALLVAQTSSPPGVYYIALLGEDDHFIAYMVKNIPRFPNGDTIRDFAAAIPITLTTTALAQSLAAAGAQYELH